MKKIKQKIQNTTKGFIPLEFFHTEFMVLLRILKRYIKTFERRFRGTLTGFTIIEALVAITILSVGLTAPLTLAYKSIQSANVAQDRITAFYFAQEGIEYIRYVRDTNVYHGYDWLRYLKHCDQGNPCEINNILESPGASGDIKNCAAVDCTPIPTNGTYFGGCCGGSWDPTRFIRNIEITDASLMEVTFDGEFIDEVEIIVTIKWKTRGKDYTYTITERMFNWNG